MAESDQFVFLALTSSEYSPRLSRSLVHEMKAEFYSLNPAIIQNDFDAAKADATFLPSLGIKYNDPSRCDKVSEAQQKIDGIKKAIQGDLVKIVIGNREVGVI